VVHAIENGRSWGALVIRPNATSQLIEATDNIVYPSLTPFTYNSQQGSIILDLGRNSGTMSSIIFPFLNSFSSTFSSQFAKTYWKIQFSGPLANYSIESLENSTDVITTPISFTFDNIHPISNVGVLAQQIGLILLLVFSFLWIMASFGFLRPLISPMKHTFSRFLVIWGFGLYATFILSLYYSSVISIYSAVSSSNFVSFWMLNWLQQVWVNVKMISERFVVWSK
jgi:hypothetical protein